MSKGHQPPEKTAVQYPRQNTQNLIILSFFICRWAHKTDGPRSALPTAGTGSVPCAGSMQSCGVTYHVFFR